MNTTDLYNQFEMIGRYLDSSETKAIVTESISGRDMMDEFLAGLAAAGINDVTLNNLITSFNTNYTAYQSDTVTFNGIKTTMEVSFEAAMTDLQAAAARLTAITRI